LKRNRPERKVRFQKEMIFTFKDTVTWRLTVTLKAKYVALFTDLHFHALFGEIKAVHPFPG